MDRWDLHSSFTKINLWQQQRFRKIVYLDADVAVLRAPDELFEIKQPFAAAPDVGWPDCFNSGVLVLSPNVADYHSLLALAQRGVSFDGADQGLLNMHFKDYHRISFRYNCTPSGHYQYVPAYRHFESDIAVLHFIGKDKPWSSSTGQTSSPTSVYDELLARWWAVYDRHYKVCLGLRSIGAFVQTLIGLQTVEESDEHSPAMLEGGPVQSHTAETKAIEPTSAAPSSEDSRRKAPFVAPQVSWDPARYSMQVQAL